MCKNVIKYPIIKYISLGFTGSKSLVAATVEPREKFIVFDLMTRKVSLYDVPYPDEVNRRHIIKSLAIMPNERHIIFSIRFNNDIRILDTSTMKEDRLIKGKATYCWYQVLLKFIKSVPVIIGVGFWFFVIFKRFSYTRRL